MLLKAVTFQLGTDKVQCNRKYCAGCPQLDIEGRKHAYCYLFEHSVSVGRYGERRVTACLEAERNAQTPAV